MGETYLIFHQLDGRLYGYFGLYKSMQEIKADGTFYDRYLYSTEWDRQSVGYSRVSFTETGIEFHPFTYSVSLPGDLPEDEKYIYVVDGKTASLHILFTIAHKAPTFISSEALPTGGVHKPSQGPTRGFTVLCCSARSKYKRHVNFSDAVFACCAFLKEPVSDPLPRLRRKLLPFHPGRTAPRPHNRISSSYASAR